MIELLKKYVEAHNEIVRTGKSDALAPLFTESAEMHFHGLDVGPFIGKEAIVRAIHEKPPSDELVLLQDGAYAWKTGGTGGELRILVEGDLIARLDVIVSHAT